MRPSSFSKKVIFGFYGHFNNFPRNGLFDKLSYGYFATNKNQDKKHQKYTQKNTKKSVEVFTGKINDVLYTFILDP